jgi:mxaA protein
MRRPLCVLILASSPGICLAEESASLLQATTREPRAFGYQVGDIVARSVSVHVPEGLVLDDTSVPQPGARGRAIELRRVVRSDSSERGGRRHELTLDYQLMLSPPQPRTLELPTLTLRFQGQPRAQELRVEAWPVTVSPLVPVDVSPRRGLGELQPDTPPPLIDASATHHRLIAYALASLLLLAYLAYVYIGLPWWSQAQRPFTQAWRSLRDLRTDSAERRWQKAFQQLHEALNRTAGEVVFEHGIDRFIGAHARFEPVRGDLRRFFQLSRRAFFADGALAAAERTWLIEFSRRCRDAERGAA